MISVLTLSGSFSLTLEPWSGLHQLLSDLAGFTSLLMYQGLIPSVPAVGQIFQPGVEHIKGISGQRNASKTLLQPIEEKIPNCRLEKI